MFGAMSLLALYFATSVYGNSGIMSVVEDKVNSSSIFILPWIDFADATSGISWTVISNIVFIFVDS